MKENIVDELIYKAGFSSTYERERLRNLIRLTVLECKKEYQSIRYFINIRGQEQVEFFPSNCRKNSLL